MGGEFEWSVKAESELQCEGGERGFSITRTACMPGQEVKKPIIRLTGDRPSGESELIQILLLALGGEMT